MVIQKLIYLKSLPVQLHTCPTLREPYGLAMSSRNLRLTSEERTRATALYRELQFIADNIGSKPFRQLEHEAGQKLIDCGFRSVDYISIADPATLIPLATWTPGQKAVVLAAAFLGEVRLIDNWVIG